MGIFGWSLPPGCGKLPGEEEYPCDLCGEFPDNCICPECPTCGSVGDVACYDPNSRHFHGMVRSQEQILTLAHNEALWEEDNRMETEYFSRIDPHLDEWPDDLLEMCGGNPK